MAFQCPWTKVAPWVWTNLDDPSEYKRVMEELHEFEKMSLDTIMRQGSHQVELRRLAKKARDRLEEIKQDDVDHLMSFRSARLSRSTLEC